MSKQENHTAVLRGHWCDYCNCETKLVSGAVVYPSYSKMIPVPAFVNKMYYQCVNNADHYVGTYRDNRTSLGRIADAELRHWKKTGHDLFDPLWKEQRYFKADRVAAYSWLSVQMELAPEYTHFGMFTIEQCKKAIACCHELIQQHKISGEEQ